MREAHRHRLMRRTAYKRACVVPGCAFASQGPLRQSSLPRAGPGKKTLGRLSLGTRLREAARRIARTPNTQARRKKGE